MTTKVWRSPAHTWCLQSLGYRSKVKWLTVTLTMYCYSVTVNFSCSRAENLLIEWPDTQIWIVSVLSRGISWSSDGQHLYPCLLTSLESWQTMHQDQWIKINNILLSCCTEIYCRIKISLLLSWSWLDRRIIRSNVRSWLWSRYQYPQCSALPNLWWEMEQSFLNWANYASPGGASF